MTSWITALLLSVVPALLTGLILFTLNIFNLRGHLLYQAWFQQLPFASLLLDQSGKIMKINSAFHRLSGYAENEVKGKPYSALFQCECSALNDFSLPFRTKEIVLNLSDGTVETGDARLPPRSDGKRSLLFFDHSGHHSTKAGSATHAISRLS